MTKQEAIQAMEQGKKVTHRYFDDDEWITMVDPYTMKDESDFQYPANKFWGHREAKYWETDWSEFQTATL